MRRGVPDGRPVRVDAALEGLPIREEQDEPLHGLEALSLDPKPTVSPRQEKSLPFGLVSRRESSRTSREEEVRPRALDRPKEPTEIRPLIRRDVRFDDAGHIVVDREITRGPPVEPIRIGFNRHGRHEGVGYVSKGQSLLG